MRGEDGKTQLKDVYIIHIYNVTKKSLATVQSAQCSSSPPPSLLPERMKTHCQDLPGHRHADFVWSNPVGQNEPPQEFPVLVAYRTTQCLTTLF